MTPADVCKQRMQLGHYSNVLGALRIIVQGEGVKALWASLPTTLLMNIPYACVMVSTNESVKLILNPSGQHNFLAFAVSGAVGGGLAAALTCPLDVIKTNIQTLSIIDCADNPMAGTGGVCRKAGVCQDVTMKINVSSMDIVRQIYHREGIRGFFKGLRPRVMLHAPSVGISWATYETCKRFIIGRQNGEIGSRVS